MKRTMDEPCPRCGGDALYAVKDKHWGPIHMCRPDDTVVPLANATLVYESDPGT